MFDEEPKVSLGNEFGENSLDLEGAGGAIEPTLPSPTNNPTGGDSTEDSYKPDWNPDSESTDEIALANYITGEPSELSQTKTEPSPSSDPENPDTDTDTDEITGESENEAELLEDSLLNYPASAADVAADVRSSQLSVSDELPADSVRSSQLSVSDELAADGTADVAADSVSSSQLSVSDELPADADEDTKVLTELDQQFAEITFDSGIFTVGESGQVIFDYLFDGGGYQGEVAAFSLKGMEECQQLGLEAYIKEALQRSLSNSAEGSVIISDKTEGARFQGELGEKDQNRGDYQGMKTVEMNPGEQFGMLLIPNGTVAGVLSEIEAKGLDALAAAKRPLFSMATANPDDGFNFGQIADVYGDNSTFVFEDLRVDGWTDKDYNDVIFQVRGATAKTALLKDVINPKKDWTDSDLGKAVEKYATREVTGNNPGSKLITDALSDRVNYAIERAENLSGYDTEALADTTQWVVGVTAGFDVSEFTTLYNAEYLGATGHIPNTHVWEFADTESAEQVAKRLDFFNGIEFAYPLVPIQIELQSAPNDELYDEQWTLKNTGQTGGKPGADANLEPAWDLAKGQGVTIGIVDSGLQYDHPDLKDNYRADLSRDFTETVDAQGNVTPYNENPTGTYDSDPAPNSSNENHGTAVAGVAVAKGNNNIGISGAAPDADFAALKLSGTVNELQIADALSYLNDDIDIYNNSWKIGSFTSTPSAEYQIEAGANQGRDGLGNVYVFAAGNDSPFTEVNHNALANSRHTIAVAATTHTDEKGVYSEEGAPVFISAPSSEHHVGVLTTDLTGSDGKSEGDYTTKFGKTSAAAPVVSGVVALMLETNPSLTYRDVQHILAESARKDLLDNNDLTAYSNDWITNGAGYDVSYQYGFGGVDAAAALELAKNWTHVGKEIKASAAQSPNIAIPDGDAIGISQTVNISEEFTVEWAEVMVDITHDLRGDLEVVLISPDGTESILVNPNLFNSGNNYDKWVFTSARHWGESSEGDWQLKVRDEYSDYNDVSGTLNEWKLNLYGSEPIVSIKATDPDANEGGDPGEFTFYRTGNTKKPLTVTYSIEGQTHWSRPKASNGSDYEEIGTTIEIPAGQSSVTLPIKPLEDTVVEWPDTVRLKITDSEDYTVSTTENLDTVVLWDNEIPEVQLYAEWYTGTPENFHQKSYTSESGDKERFLLRRYGSVEEDLTVYYSLPGTAVNGVDYEELPGSITIPAGLHDVYFNLIPIDDEEIEGEETVQFTLTPNPSYRFKYEQGRVWDNIPVTIWDNDDKPTVSIQATDATASEYGDPGEFTITRTGDTNNPLTVDYWISTWWWDKAKNGEDYQKIPETIVIPAGESSATIQIQPIDDAETEKDEIVDIYLKSNPAYAIGVKEYAKLTIDDNETPSIAWQKQLGTPEYDHANSVTTDSAGNVYTTGRTTGDLAGTNAGLGDAFVNKFDDNGNLLWQRQLGTSGYDEANGISVDDAGNVYLTGWTDGAFDGNSSDRDPWIAKYDPNGNLIWKKQLGSEAYDISNGAISVAGDGSIYITGRTYGNLGGNNQGDMDAWVAKYDRNGDREWIEQLGTAAWDEAQSVAVDADNNVYLTGHTQGKLGATHAGESDAWVAKYDSNGNQQWMQQLGTDDRDLGFSVAVNNQGNVYVSGQSYGWLGHTYEGDPDDWIGDRDAWWRAIHGDKSGLGGTYYGNGDAWVAQFDSVTGELRWKRLLGTTAADSSTGVTVDEFGNVYLTGTTRGELVSGTPAKGGDDVFVAKYSETGALQWKQQFGSAGEDVAKGIAFNGSGLFFTGYTSMDLAHESNQGKDDIWLMKLA